MNPGNLGSALGRFVKAIGAVLRPASGHEYIDAIKDQIDATLQSMPKQSYSKAWVSRVLSSIEDELGVFWRMGKLKGATSEEAFFVRCDETTMTDEDVAALRVICLIGVAPVTPGEYTLFTVEQQCLPTTPPTSSVPGD